jgi:phosphate/sulfate permease
LNILNKALKITSDIISNPFVSSILGGIISGLIIWYFLQRREKQRWRKAKEFIEKDWLVLLNATFYTLEMFLEWSVLFGYPGLNWNDFIKIHVLPQEALLKARIEDFKKNLLPEFEKKYYPKISTYEKNDWKNFHAEIRDIITHGEILISRILSFTHTTPDVIQRINDWKNRIASLEFFCESVISAFDIPNNDKVTTDRNFSSSLIVNFIEDFIKIAEEELKFRPQKVVTKVILKIN